MEPVESTSRTQRAILWIVVIGVLALVGLMVTKVVLWEIRPRTTVSISGSVFRVDIVDTEETRQKGLGGRSSLGKDEGMLFVFNTERFWSFWMKGMKFPIDIIWLDKDNQVVHIEHDVQPDSEPYTEYTPPEPAQYVLEIAAGQAKRANIRVGSVMKVDVAEEGL